MVKTNYSGSADLFYEKTGGFFMHSVSRPSKDGLMLLTWFSDFDLKIRCEVGRLWRRVAVASVDHPYMMYGCVFLYK